MNITITSKNGSPSFKYENYLYTINVKQANGKKFELNEVIEVEDIYVDRHHKCARFTLDGQRFTASLML